MSDVLELNEKNWESEVITAEGPVLVDFWAPWCGPCKALAPTVEAIAHENAGKLKVAKLNTDEAGPVAAKYGVMSIPALMLFKGGKVVVQMIGSQPKTKIMEQLQPHL